MGGVRRNKTASPLQINGRRESRERSRIVRSRLKKGESRKENASTLFFWFVSLERFSASFLIVHLATTWGIKLVVVKPSSVNRFNLSGKRKLFKETLCKPQLFFSHLTAAAATAAAAVLCFPSLLERKARHEKRLFDGRRQNPYRRRSLVSLHRIRNLSDSREAGGSETWGWG